MPRKKAKLSTAPVLRYFAHRTIFLPAIIVALIYGGVWVLLLAVGQGDSALATLSLLVLLMVVPILIVKAYLRYVTFELRIARNSLRFHDGWIRPRWRTVSFDELDSAMATRTAIGNLFGGGALTLSRTAEKPIRLFDVAFPEKAARQINKRLRAAVSRASKR